MKISLVTCLIAAAGFVLPAGATTDPKGDATQSLGDIVSFVASGQAGRLDIQLQASSVYDFAGTQFLIDIDLNAKTGFGFGSIGADVLIEGDQIYAFEGESPEDWGWKNTGSITRKTAERTLTVSASAKLIGSDEFAIIARTLDQSFQQIDRAPDRSAMLVKLSEQGKDGEGPAPFVEKEGDCKDPGRDLIAFSSKLIKSQAVFQLKTAEPSDFATLLLFIDSDLDASTGYQPSGEDTHGFDYLISGDQILHYSASNRSEWVWEKIAAVDRQANKNSLRLSFDPGVLASKEIGVAAWFMDGDWQSCVDQAPDAGQGLLSLDLSGVEPAEQPKKIEPASRKKNADLPARERVAQSQSFYCYYGQGRVNELSHYDVVILHCPPFSSSDVATLNKLGVVTIAYLTVGEDDKQRAGNGTGPGGLASWYLDRDKDGQPDQNGIWKSWYANANDPLWRADRIKEAKRLIQEGYDGVFLDTLDTAQLYPETEDGMIKLVEGLREALPDAPIILNQGFKLFHRLAPLSDGLMLESFTATYDFEAKQYKMNSLSSLDAHTRNVQKNLQPTLDKHPMPIFVLDYAQPDDVKTIQTAADRASSFGYQFAVAPILLDDVFINDIVGNPDPEWLEMQATPESMSITLSEVLNGFPAGTVVTPSSCYAGYSVVPLVDPTDDRSETHWSKAAWASSESEEAVWLRVVLPSVRQQGSLTIRWATDADVVHVSQDYVVQVRSDKYADWQTVNKVLDQSGDSITLALNNAPYREIQILQQPGGGSNGRPDLMWIAQLKLGE